MAANAPYYQLHTSTINSHSSMGSVRQPGEEEYNGQPCAENIASTQNEVEQENHQLAELLEAANEAAGLRDGVLAPELRRTESVKRHTAAVPQGRGKRKRAASSPQRDGELEPSERLPERAKRAKKGPTTIVLVQDPALDTIGQQTRQPVKTIHVTNTIVPSTIIGGSVDNAGPPLPSQAASYEAEPTILNPLPDVAGNNTSPHNVDPIPLNPATALFRRPPVIAPKKYTRPPMSKLFVSLQLAPENFLQLQAQAKAYMLDPAHPERQACVGNRGKGDTDMVKLRLFRCVNEFLVQGAGEQFFGIGAQGREVGREVRGPPGAGEGGGVGKQDPGVETKWIWPRDGNTIVGLVTPLLRRMVTNERQRVYAIETRKGGKRKEGMGGGDGADQGAEMGGLEGLGFELHPPHLDPSLGAPISPSSYNLQNAHLGALQHIPPLESPNELTNSDNLLVISVSFSSLDSRPLRSTLDLASPAFDLWYLRYADLRAIIEQSIANIGITREGQDTIQPNLAYRNGDSIPHKQPNNSGSKIALPDPNPTLLRGLARAAAGLETEEDVDLEEGGVRLDQPSHRASPQEARADDSARPRTTSDAPKIRVDVLLRTGLSRIRSEEEWARAKREVSGTFWLQGRCTVVVTAGLNDEG